MLGTAEMVVDGSSYLLYCDVADDTDRLGLLRGSMSSTCPIPDELFRPCIPPGIYLFGDGAGELRVRVDEVSDLAGDGLARIGTSNLAGLAELDGIVMGLSLGEEDDVWTLVLLDMLVAGPVGWRIADEIGDGFMLRPDGRLSCSCKLRISNLSSLLCSAGDFSTVKSK